MNAPKNRCLGGLLTVLLLCGPSASAAAQDDEAQAPVEIFLDEDRIEAEADLPSVDFILDFKGLRYQNIDKPEDFIPELLESVEKDPF